VRVENAISSDLIFQRKGLGFELNPVFSCDLGPHVHGRRLLFVWVTELEDDFGIAHREAIHIGDAPA
jgi:hypothetical protein